MEFGFVAWPGGVVDGFSTDAARIAPDVSRSRRPPPTYLIPGIPFAAEVLTYVADKAFDQALSLQPWYPKLPGGWLLAVITAFTGGLVIQDLKDHNSWLRVWWRDINRLADIDPLVPATRTETNREWIALTLHLRFTRAVRNAVLTIAADSGFTHPRARRTHVLVNKEIPRVAVGTIESNVIAVIPLKRYDNAPSGYQTWGPEYHESGNPGSTLFANSENIITVEVRSGWRRQTERLFFAVNGTSGQGSHGRLFIPSEDVADVLADLEPPTPKA